MSILISIKTISVLYFILARNKSDNSVFNVFIVHNRHFLPFGRALLYNRVGGRSLRCKGFAVDDPNLNFLKMYYIIQVNHNI
jgi:hypothetical protein